jgi:hypothetical protein
MRITSSCDLSHISTHPSPCWHAPCCTIRSIPFCPVLGSPCDSAGVSSPRLRRCRLFLPSSSFPPPRPIIPGAHPRRGCNLPPYAPSATGVLRTAWATCATRAAGGPGGECNGPTCSPLPRSCVMVSASVRQLRVISFREQTGTTSVRSNMSSNASIRSGRNAGPKHTPVSVCRKSNCVSSCTPRGVYWQHRTGR